MNTDTLDIKVDAGSHVVHFHDGDAQLIDIVGAYFTDGLRDGAVGIAILTSAHRQALEQRLRASGVEVEAELDRGSLIIRDAAEILAAIRVDGKIDPQRFQSVVGSLVREAAGTGRPVRVFGEVVALLWEEGHMPGAIDLEGLWNDLGREVPFSLLCAYGRESVQDPAHSESLRHVCNLHTSVVEAGNGRNGLVPDQAPFAAIRQFPAELSSSREARHFLVSTLRERGLDGALLQDAQIVVSELASNAIVHAGSPFSVALRIDSSGLRIAVGDRSSRSPSLKKDDSSNSGRGLRLVDELAQRWGVERTGEGKQVWAELSE